MGITNISGAISIAACLLTTSCVSRNAEAASRPIPAASITFRNQGLDRIQVFLISEKNHWLIGRLEPLETAHLPLPRFGFASATQSVALAVVPGWTPNVQPRRDPHVTLSIEEVSDNLPGEEWIFVNGHVGGPLRRQAP